MRWLFIISQIRTELAQKLEISANFSWMRGLNMCSGRRLAERILWGILELERPVTSVGEPYATGRSFRPPRTNLLQPIRLYEGVSMGKGRGTPIML
jgi:hypothetical protein